jgi:hypothetical protein
MTMRINGIAVPMADGREDSTISQHGIVYARLFKEHPDVYVMSIRADHGGMLRYKTFKTYDEGEAEMFRYGDALMSTAGDSDAMTRYAMGSWWSKDGRTVGEA